MSTLVYVLLFTFIGSIGALIGGVVLLSKKNFALKIAHFLSSFAAGTLLGTAFLDLLPESLEKSGKSQTDIFFWTLIGIVGFFFLERFIHWFHHHEKDHEHNHSKETKSTLPLIIIGDTVHNLLDGIVIAATFLVNIPLGVVTALAVFAHEIPQEIGDFGLMLHKGLARKKIIMVNILSAAISIMGAIITYLLGNVLGAYLSIFLALTAGFFIYIATSDLIPEIHHEKSKKFAMIKSLLFLLGIIFIWFSASFLEPGH